MFCLIALVPIEKLYVIYNVPITSKPNIVIIDHSRKSIIDTELTFPFEINISKSHDNKTNIYFQISCITLLDRVITKIIAI